MSKFTKTKNIMSASAAHHPAADVRCFPCQGAALHNLHAVKRQSLHLRHQFTPCQQRSPWFDQQHWWEGRFVWRQSCTAPLQSALYFAWRSNTPGRALCLLFPLLPLLQAVQPWHADSCGRSLCERASVLRPTCRQHVAGQRDGPEGSGGGGFHLWSMRDETNRQSAQNVPWVTLGSWL